MAGGGADLDVSIKEADGTVTRYLVPFSSVPNMLQAGVSKYDLAAGRSHIEGPIGRLILFRGPISMV
jgi:outer membrane usher protein